MSSDDLPLLDCPTYKWIFVGGKGGVGKTTTSCAIATLLARRRKSVLLVSTDPASNIGDTFQQHFSSNPTLVNGFDNLWAMNGPAQEKDTGEASSLLTLPGVDEMTVLAALFMSIETDQYDVVVFDTAPTGHTFRLLQLPKNCARMFGAMGMLQNVISSTIAQAAGSEAAMRQLQMVQELAPRAGQRLTNSRECTFVCVTLPKFSPLWETERLVEFLTEQEIETHTLIVNQVMEKEEGCTCKKCNAQYAAQQKILDDIHEAYDDFRILHVPEMDTEIKGLDAVLKFAELLKPLVSP